MRDPLYFEEKIPMPEINHHKTALLKSIQREWDALLSVIDRLSPEQMTAPDAGGWSPKDNLVHVTEWMKVLSGYHIDKQPPHVVLGLTPEQVKDWDPDIINPVLFERNKDRSSADVLTELKSVYAGVIARLESMPFEDLLKPRRADDPQKRPLVLWVLGDTSDHFAEHRASIEKVLR
jgi:hypothetical protein